MSLNTYKFAAIDIGSNAIRLLIIHAIEYENQTHFKKNTLLRVPIRLGSDSFTQNCISQRNHQRLLDAMISFKHLLAAHEAIGCIATATSAMRDATNGPEIVNEIFEKTGFKIHIISGEQEASLIYATHVEKYLDPLKSFMYIDIGGGSTEITLFANNEVLASKSFNIGTIRVLHDLTKSAEWDNMKQWLKSHTAHLPLVEGIGSGGNVNRLYKMSGKTNWRPLTLAELKKFYQMLSEYSYEERVTKLNLNTDRADVIVPATRILISAMKWAKAKNLNVPKMGLADGVVRKMYAYFKQQGHIADEVILGIEQ